MVCIPYALSLARPFLRRLDIIFRPEAVDILARKPTFLFRFLLDGWYTRFINLHPSRQWCSPPHLEQAENAQKARKATISRQEVKQRICRSWPFRGTLAMECRSRLSCGLAENGLGNGAAVRKNRRVSGAPRSPYRRGDQVVATRKEQKHVQLPGQLI